MFEFNNTHIFTGYLKQLLSTYNLPTCKIYTREFADYFSQHGEEDPRVIESFEAIEYFYKNNEAISKKRNTTHVSYLKNNELYNYIWPFKQDMPNLNHDNSAWKRISSVFYHNDKHIPGLTRTLKSTGSVYDTTTHEYLGEYLRFLRDYYNINLMSMYNCFSNATCNNIYYKQKIKVANPNFDKSLAAGPTNKEYLESYRIFDSRDSQYRIYALPVKLFADYTIAIDCSYDIEMFCGIYKTSLDTSERSVDLINRTYKKINRPLFNQPFLYDKLNVKYWKFESDISTAAVDYPQLFNTKAITRWDIAAREQDLKLFIKVPVACKSSIVVLEGDFRNFNDTRYVPPGVYLPDGSTIKHEIEGESAYKTASTWEFRQNHAAVNFGNQNSLNTTMFRPIGKLQLLVINTGKSYPFSDRLVEYLSNSAITPIDDIADNIKRAQKVMTQNGHHFKIEGLWEDKMQKIIYDYLVNSGPIEVKDGKLTDRHSGVNPKNYGYHPKLGQASKSTLFDVLGYVDKDAEKWYASWAKDEDTAKIIDTIQNVDIYNGLYDI